MAIKKMVSEDAVVPETIQGDTVKVATIGGKEIKAPVGGGSGTDENAVHYTAESKTDAQKAQARQNIGSGTSNFSGNYGDLSGVPQTFAPSAHDHENDSWFTSAIGAVKTWANGVFAAISHTHTKSQITDFPTLATVATSGDYNDLSNKPTIPSSVTESTVSGWGFTKNAGTVTGITMNGASKGTSGVVDLGTVITAHQDISGKAGTLECGDGASKQTVTVTGGVAKLDDFFKNSNTLLNGRLAYERNATGLKDRAFNALTFDGTEYNLSTALAAVTPTASGQPRDLLIVATATAATTISFTAGTIKGDKPTIDGAGTWLITLTEYAANTWYCRQIKMEDAA